MHGSDPFLKKDITALYKSSLLIAAMMSAASVAGLLFPGFIYPTQTLRQMFMSNDLVNLLLGLPILIGSMALSKRGKLIGLLFWPGALLYILYNTLAYAKETVEQIAGHFNELLSQVIENETTRLKDLKISHNLVGAESTVSDEDYTAFQL